MGTRDNLIKKGFDVFTKMFMKYDIFGKRPLEMGNGSKINTSNVHTIEAIGKGYANTVTSLSGYFRITKGAVSQCISKLHEDGYLKKKKASNKLIVLELTEPGKQVLKLHEKYNASFVKKIRAIEKKYTDIEIKTFLNILTDVDTIFGEFIEEVK
jgi:DNA-binding MarR family transcriptional regulator